MSTICVNCGTGIESEHLVCESCHQRINEGKVFVNNPGAVFVIHKRPVKDVLLTAEHLIEDGKYWRELIGESSQ